MAKKRHEKVCAVIKTYLVSHQGEWFTAKQITDFISSNNFGLGNYYLSPMVVSSLLMRKDGIFSDIESEKQWNIKRYRYNGNGRANN